MGKPKAPTPPDPKVTAGAQTATNIGTAIADKTLNFTNQVTPYGTLTYNKTGLETYKDPNTGQTHKIPQYTAVTKLSPAQQDLLNKSNATSRNLADMGVEQSGRIRSLLSRPVDTATGVPAMRTSFDDGSLDRNRVEAALMERMQPGLDRRKSALEARLASQGIRMGSEAYSAAMADNTTAENDARMAAILSAGQEQQRAAAIAQSQAAFNNNARKDMLAERYTARNQPINEISALMSGSQVQSPRFANTPQTSLANTDVAGLTMAAHKAKMDNYNAKQGMWGGLLGLGANLILSDRRAKENIKRIGKTYDGQNIYSYNYKSGGPTQIGMMAQEVAKKKPDAVRDIGGGLKAVDYARATR